MRINIKKLTETAKLPERGSAYAAGYDLFADLKEAVEIAPKQTLMINTGVAMEIPEGYWGGIFARSGLSSKEGLRPANCVVVIGRAAFPSGRTGSARCEALLNGNLRNVNHRREIPPPYDLIC